jgi:hypothetical protein
MAIFDRIFNILLPGYLTQSVFEEIWDFSAQEN